jgi:hypothetical protein
VAGKGCRDNVFVERLWVKYEWVYLRGYDRVSSEFDRPLLSTRTVECTGRDVSARILMQCRRARRDLGLERARHP